MSLGRPLLAAIASAWIVATPATIWGQAQAPRDDASAPDFFEKKIRPVLVNNCYNCHSANTNAKGGLRVDDRNGLLQGGNSGPAVVPGDPDESLLLKAVAYADDLKMPPKKQLSPREVADIAAWIKAGAAWPEERAVAVAKVNPKYEALRKGHWAWQPLADAKPPAVRDAAWPRGDVDRFILSGLEAKGLAPARDADRATLIRRVTFDLTGLPPTPEEIDAFTRDGSPTAYEALVDRLLGSPAFGEQWGRHWLDVARYGESTGSSRNVPFPHAWRYRDYVVDAFAKDKPFDQFLREQVAGDLLPARSQAERDEHAVATGFLALGVKDVNQRFKVRFVMDNVDEQIDTLTRSILATTASCARCHDHKFDPIPTADYYALAGIFTSTDLCAGVRNKMGGGGLDYYDTAMLLRIGAGTASASASPEKIKAATEAVAKARAEFVALRDSPAGAEPGPGGRPKRFYARQKMNKLQADLLALTDPASNGGQVALGVRDAKAPADTEIRLRGEAEKLGAKSPRGFLSALNVPDAPKVNPAQSGRLELAQWLTNGRNPLTPRVFVNRVWHHLFDAGLVRSVDNFGATGDVPSHPELLDHLAARFVRDGWSVKKLVRVVVTSRAYRLDSSAIPTNVAVDPANRLVWRHSPRRLTAEEVRDATLAASGGLDPARPVASAAKELKVVEMPNNGPLARKLAEAARASRHRSVYLPLVRGVTPTSLEVFDFAEQGMVTGRRDATTVATQALYLLNDPFVRRQALTLADRVAKRADLDDAARVDLAHRLTLGRPASPAEIARARAYLADYEAADRNAIASAPPKPEPAVIVAQAEEPDGAGAKKPAVPINPDEVIQEDAPVVEEAVLAPDSKAAAWASLCQALLGSAEFRYVR